MLALGAYVGSVINNILFSKNNFARDQINCDFHGNLNVRLRVKRTLLSLILLACP